MNGCQLIFFVLDKPICCYFLDTNKMIQLYDLLPNMWYLDKKTQLYNTILTAL